MPGYPQCNSFSKKIDGIEVLKVHKADEHLGNTPVVRLNSSRRAPNLTDCYDYCVNTHGVKPEGFNGSVKAGSQLDFFWRRSTNLR
jgi:hypothetical protein